MDMGIIISILWILCGVMYGYQQYKGYSPSWLQLWGLYICYVVSVVVPICLSYFI